MDYTIPAAVEMPLFDIRYVQTPSPFTPLGMKGIGVSGVGLALGALCGAIETAFPELDVRLDSLFLTPCRAWWAIQEAHQRLREQQKADAGA